MRKLLLLTTVLVSVVLGCTKIDVERDNYGNEGIIFYAGSEEDTKVTYDPDTYKFSWIANEDEVGITGQVGTAEPYAYSVVYTPDKSGTSAILTPKTTGIDWSNETDEHTFYAYYPTKSKVATYENNDVVVNFPFEAEQTQLETNNSDHMGSYTFATSSRKATPPSDSKVGFNFKHHVAFFEFHVSAVANNTMTIQKIEVTAAEPVGASAVQYSFKDNAVKLVSGEYTTATLNFTKAMPVTTALQKGWLAIAPGTYAKLTFTVTYTDGTTQVIEKTPNAALKAGSVNTVPITAAPKGGSVVIDPTKLCDISGANMQYCAMDAFTIGDLTVNNILASTKAYDDITKTATANVVPGATISISFTTNTGGAGDNYNIALYVDWNKDGDLTEIERIFMASAKQPASLTEVYKGEFTAPEGILSGTYFARILNGYSNKGIDGCGNYHESSTIRDFTIEFASSEDPDAPAKARIAAADGLQVAFDKDATASIVKTINISLTKTSETSTTINLAATTDAPLLTGVLSTNSITIPAGETTATATITFAPTVFILDTKANITVTATSTDVELIPLAESLKYTVAGPIGMLPGPVTYYMEYYDNGWTNFDGTATTSIAYDIVLDSETPANPKPIFDYEVTGTLAKNDFSLDYSNSFSEETYGYIHVRINSSAIGKTGTLKLTSNDIVISEGQGITFTEIK